MKHSFKKSFILKTMEVTRAELAFAYKIFAHLGWDDATYTHLSARVPGKDTFLIQPFGLMYHEVTPDNLIEIDFNGHVVDEINASYNSTGYVIHASIYKKRHDLNAIFHLHTIAGVTISTMECGLVPISQFSFHFYNKVSYHDYNSLSLDFHNQGTVVYQALAETLEKDLAVSGGSGILCTTSFGEFHVCTHGAAGAGYIGIDGFYINAEDSKYVSQDIDTFRESFPCSCCRL
jgi:ribulose-5-phosphate 4-epimerase/fuculose-1-phosphate aldolase